MAKIVESPAFVKTTAGKPKSRLRQDYGGHSEVKSSKFGTIIRSIFYILIFFVPLIMYSGTTELFEFNKMLFIYASATLIGALMSADLILYKKKLFNHTILNAVFALFLISEILSTIFSIDIHTSLFGYYGRFNGGLFSIIAYIILFYSFINYFNLEGLQRLLKISLLSSLVVIFWGIPGKLGYDMSCWLFTRELNNSCWTDQFRPAERMFSTLGQPNWLGAYLAIQFFIAIYFLLKQKKLLSWSSSSIYIYLFLNFTALLFTRSRSALGALGISFFLLPVFIILIYRKNTLKSLPTKVYGILIGIIVISVLIFHTGVDKIDRYITLPSKTVETSLKVSNAGVPAKTQTVVSGVTDSFDIRKIVWKGAIELGNKYPILGTGVETFAYSYYFARPVEHNLTSEWDFLYNKAHNEFLNYFATTGYTGLITYSLLILTTFILGIRYIILFEKDTDNALLVACLLLAYLTIHVTNFFGFSISIVNVFFYLISAFIVVIRYNLPDGEPVGQNNSLNRKLLLAIPIFFTIYIMTFLYQYISTDMRYSAAEQFTRMSEYDKAAQTYSDMLKHHYEHVYEDKLSYVLANLVYVATYQKDTNTAARLTKLAQYYNQKSMMASVGNINYMKTTVKNNYLFYQSTQNPQYLKDGIDSLQKAEKISPTDPKLPYSAALFYSLLEDEEKDPQMKETYQAQSLQSINDSIRLKSDYRDSYFLKAQLLKKYGNSEEAKKMLNFILQHINPADEEVQKELGTL